MPPNELADTLTSTNCQRIPGELPHGIDDVEEPSANNPKQEPKARAAERIACYPGRSGRGQLGENGKTGGGAGGGVRTILSSRYNM